MVILAVSVIDRVKTFCAILVESTISKKATFEKRIFAKFMLDWISSDLLLLKYLQQRSEN
jgi:hypothetical protein